MFSKETRASCIDKVVDLGVLSTELAKLAFPYFHYVMISLQISRGLSGFLIFLRSVRKPCLVPDPSGDLAYVTMPETALELEDGAFVLGVGGGYESIHGIFADCDFSSGVPSVLNGYLVIMRQPVHPVIS